MDLGCVSALRGRHSAKRSEVYRSLCSPIRGRSSSCVGCHQRCGSCGHRRCRSAKARSRETAWINRYRAASAREAILLRPGRHRTPPPPSRLRSGSGAWVVDTADVINLPINCQIAAKPRSRISGVAVFDSSRHFFAVRRVPQVLRCVQFDMAQSNIREGFGEGPVNASRQGPRRLSASSQTLASSTSRYIANWRTSDT